jgi:hypothetical protein
MSDMNIDDWGIDDIEELIGVNQTSTYEEIISATKQLINRARAQGNDEYVKFIANAAEKLINNYSNENVNQYNIDHEENDEDDNNTITDETIMNQKQYFDDDDKNQSNKVTDRNNKVKLFDDDTHFQMKKKRLGVNQSYEVPVVQGTINPMQKNVLTKTVVINSNYRPILFPYANSDLNKPSFNTDFTVTLSETLHNVVSIELYSIQIPRTWYNIDSYTGNNSFSIYNSTNFTEKFIITIPSGNYNEDFSNVSNFEKLINGKILEKIPSGELSLKWDSASKYRFYFNNTDLSNNYTIEFYNPKGFIDSSGNGASCTTTSYPNNSLGWTLGFRTTPDEDNIVYIDVEKAQSNLNPSREYAEAYPKMFGSHNAFIVLDDFNKNRQSRGVVGASDITTKISIPTYASNDNVGCDSSTNKPSYLKTAPRRLTQAQLYTINSIVDDREQMRFRTPAPTTNDVLAVIPLTSNVEYGQMILRYGVDLSVNKRVYFGPVDIDRLHVKLLDDNGIPINLNGSDWSFSFNVNYLYQY